MDAPYNMLFVFPTWLVFHRDRSPLKGNAYKNMLAIEKTLLVLQFDKLWLKA